MATIAIVLWQCLDGIMSCWRMALISLGIRRAPMQETNRHRQQAAVWGCKSEKNKTKSAGSEGSCFKNPCVDRCFTDDFPILTLHHNFYLLIILKWNLSGWDITYILLILMNEGRYHVDSFRLNIMRIFSRKNSFFEFRLNVSLLWLVFFFRKLPAYQANSHVHRFYYIAMRSLRWLRGKNQLPTATHDNLISARFKGKSEPEFIIRYQTSSVTFRCHIERMRYDFPQLVVGIGNRSVKHCNAQQAATGPWRTANVPACTNKKPRAG